MDGMSYLSDGSYSIAADFSSISYKSYKVTAF